MKGTHSFLLLILTNFYSPEKKSKVKLTRSSIVVSYEKLKYLKKELVEGYIKATENGTPLSMIDKKYKIK